ncbi:hypothetical protein Sste5344_007727 [Sporothrix stenoceras]
MKVVLADRNFEGAQDVARELNKEGHQVAWAVMIDVADWEAQRAGFEAAVELLGGRIDYVFAVAGIFDVAWLPNRPKATTFEKPNLAPIDINATGALYTSSLAIQQFRRQEANKHGFHGKLVIVASGAGFYMIPAMPLYCASKTAIVGFVRSMGKLLAAENITLNAICPGIMRTAISTGDFHDTAEKRGLLVSPVTLVAAFEQLLGTDGTTGEAIEVMPDGAVIKEGAAYTNEDCRVRAEWAHQQTLQGNKVLAQSFH